MVKLPNLNLHLACQKSQGVALCLTTLADDQAYIWGLNLVFLAGLFLAAFAARAWTPPNVSLLAGYVPLPLLT